MVRLTSILYIDTWRILSEEMRDVFRPISTLIECLSLFYCDRDIAGLLHRIG